MTGSPLSQACAFQDPALRAAPERRLPFALGGSLGLALLAHVLNCLQGVHKDQSALIQALMTNHKHYTVYGGWRWAHHSRLTAFPQWRSCCGSNWPWGSNVPVLRPNR